MPGPTPRRSRFHFCLLVLGAGLIAHLLPAAVARAGSSTTFWTPMTLDIQPHGVFHLGVDNYFTVVRKASDGGGSFPTDLTLPEVGIALSSKVQMEFGVEYFGGADDPWYLNAKIGSPEDVWFKGQPDLGVEIPR